MFVVVGGHSRNIGKTSAVCSLIRRTRELKWAAVKITQYGHGICSSKGEPCSCAPEDPSDAEHPFAISEEYEPNETDSGRFLKAGADRAFWLRAPSGELARAAATISKLLAQNENVIAESNSVVDLVKPDLFLMLLDFSCQDFKASSLRLMDRADAFLIVDRGLNAPMWDDVSRGLWDGKPQFLVKAPSYLTAAVTAFVRERSVSAAR